MMDAGCVDCVGNEIGIPRKRGHHTHDFFTGSVRKVGDMIHVDM